MTSKIALCLTFPNDYWDICAKEMLRGISRNWPKDIKVYIQLDEQTEDEFTDINNSIVDIMGEGRVFIAGKWEDDQKKFLERWKDHKPESYMFDVVRFSHKVYALEKCAAAIKDTHDYLIWLDADVITKGEVTEEWLKDVLPGENEVCSYLGRNKKDNVIDYSECGWVAYNLKKGGHELLAMMKTAYDTDKFKELEDGWTDCHIFDKCRGKKKAKNLSKDVKGTDVWPFTKLAEKMVHRKGARKHTKPDEPKKPVEKPVKQVVDVDNIQIKTKNCLDHEKICSNVRNNLKQIRNWVTICKPTTDKNGKKHEIVVCSAGSSLSNHIEEIKERQRNGAKVIAVKHALDTLEKHNIKPWACVLLDPRAHVEGFIKRPDPDVIYFVASMCDPSVVKTLNENKCTVIGYHALVNAGELNELIPSDLPVTGGSATSTRSLALFMDMFGYEDFHLYGYDLCHYEKPNLQEVLEDGNPKYMEVPIGTYTYANDYINRTYWTEGQFLAQSNELRNLYKERKGLNMNIYGDGIAGWLFKHWKLYQQYKDEYNDHIEEERKETPTLDEYVNACTRGTRLSRHYG